MSSQPIEIHNDEKYRYLLDAEYQGTNFIVFILRLRKVIRNDEYDDEYGYSHPSAAFKHDLLGNYKNRTSAINDAYEIARRISNGNLTLSLPTMKKSVDKYRLLASAIYIVDFRKWESNLKIISKRPENKNASQDFSRVNSPLKQNRFPSSERAIAFALQYGEEIIRGSTPGLKV